MLAGQVDDGADRQARRVLEVDQQLAGAVVPVGGGAAGPAEQDHIVRLVREAGPDLGAGDAVDIAVLHRLGPGRGKVRSGIGLAHADAESQFARGDAGQQGFLLLVRAELDDRRAGLPVGNPVRTDRGTPSQRFLDHDIALIGAALVPAVLLRPGHAEIAGLAHFQAELAVEPVPVIAALARGAVAQVLVEERAELGAQSQDFVAVQRRGGEGNRAHSSVTIGQYPSPPAATAALPSSLAQNTWPPNSSRQVHSEVV